MNHVQTGLTHVIPARLVQARASQSDLHTSTGKAASRGGRPGYWPGPAYLPIWCWPSKSVTAWCQLHSLSSHQVSGCFSIGLECDATSSPPRPVSSSQSMSALKRSMLRLCLAKSWRGRGGGADPAPDVRHQPPGKEVNVYF